jgi:nicotinamide-nucleotide amidase
MTQTETIDLPRELEDAVGRVLERACALELRLATAESCTGGLVASMLTDVEGCSHAFERGFVVYTDEAKRELLGVGAEILGRDGAVSKACALAMAEGALARSAADIAVALTGYAGPTQDGGEEGLVHLACAGRGRATHHLEAHYGAIGRGPVRLACARDALSMLEAMLG